MDDIVFTEKFLIRSAFFMTFNFSILFYVNVENKNSKEKNKQCFFMLFAILYFPI